MAYALLAPRPTSHPFLERQLSLKEPIKIGRAVAKAKSTVGNGIFDCKVLSRNHAVMWYENGKFMLQDTKSSNGTYVNSVRLSRGTEESEPCEIKSGDILQFGVEVVENSKNVTHGCIVGLVTLFHEDGSEAIGPQVGSPQGQLAIATIKNIQPHELQELWLFLQDALHREQMLENKLATLQRMISNSHAASEDTFQGFIQEDKLLSRLETLENQLELVSKSMTEEEVQSELVAHQDERLRYESAAKQTLQDILKEKIDILQKCSELERTLSNTEDECSHLRITQEKSKEDLQNIMNKHKQQTEEMDTLNEEIAASTKLHETICQQNATDKSELKTQLDEAERRGSALAVEVESLQAECDFTKKQLEAVKAMKEMESNQSDLPFASDHATLEKDVRNKSEYIKLLKEQLNNVQLQLDEERENKKTENSSDFTTLDMYNHAMQVQALKDLMIVTRSHLVSLSKNLNYDEVLDSSSWHDVDQFNDETLRSIEDQLLFCKNSLESITILSELCNSDLERLCPCVSNKFSTDANVECNDNQIQEELTAAYGELEELKSQILVLGEGLVEEQDANKRTQELAASLEQQLYEAHKHMNIEKMETSMSFTSLENARKLAEEMRKQASDSAKTAGQGKAQNDHLIEENKTLKMKITRLESEYKKLQQEKSLLATFSPLKTRTVTRASHQSQDAESSLDCSVDDLQESLNAANLSYEELTQIKEEENQRNLSKQSQLTNLILTLFFLVLMFGILVMLGIIHVTPGSLPLLDERTWTEILEHLF